MKLNKKVLLFDRKRLTTCAITALTLLSGVVPPLLAVPWRGLWTRPVIALGGTPLHRTWDRIFDRTSDRTREYPPPEKTRDQSGGVPLPVKT